MKRKTVGKVFIKFLFTFLLIVLIPIIVLGWTILFSFSSIVNQELSSYNNVLLTNTAKQIESHMLEIRGALQRFSLFNWQLSNHYYLDKPIPLEFKSLSMTNDFITDCFVYFPLDDRVIDSSGLSEADFFFSNTLGLADDDSRNFKAQLDKFPSFSLTETLETKINHQNERSIIMLNAYPKFTQSPTGVIGIIIDANKILDIASLSARMDAGLGFYIYDNDLKPLLTSYAGSSKNTQYEKLEKLLRDNEQSLDKQLRVNDGKESFLISVYKSEVFPITYVMLKDFKKVALISSNMRKTTVFIMLLLILVGVILSIIISKNFYKPIYKILNVLHDSEDEQRTDEQEDEFELITSLINDIKIKNTKFEDQNIEHTRLLQEYYVQNLLLGINIPNSGDDFAFDRNCFVFSEFYAVVVYIAYDEITLDEHKNRIGELTGIINDVLHRRDDTVGIITGVEPYRLSLIINCRGNDSLTTTIETVFDSINNITDKREFNTIIGIGQMVGAIDDISSSYKQAQAALKYRTAGSKTQIIYYDRLRDTDMNNIFIYYPISVEKKIIYDLVQGDFGASYASVEQLIGKNELGSATVKKLEYFHSQLIGTARKAILLSSLPDEEKFNMLMQCVDILDTDSPSRVKNSIYNTYHKIAQHIAEGKCSRKSDLIQSMMQYVEQNYMSDISLDILSDEFGFSAKYLSACFKNNTGMNYIDYLNSVRIENAKKLMTENSNMKISDIATRVGFLSSNTFIATFRKYEGMTPGKYRETI